MRLLVRGDVVPEHTLRPVSELSNLNNFKFIWQLVPNTYYVGIMYDINAPESPFVHHLFVNFDGGSLVNTIIPYMPPNPPNDESHRYVVAVYAQHGYISNPGMISTRRHSFDLNSLIKTFNLDLVANGTLTASRTSYTWSDPPVSTRGQSHRLIKPDMNDEHAGYCACIVEVTLKQTDECLKTHDWKHNVGGHQCYNPYAVCSASTHGTIRHCHDYYNYEQFTDEELKALSELKNKPQGSRQQMINSLKQ